MRNSDTFFREIDGSEVGNYIKPELLNPIYGSILERIGSGNPAHSKNGMGVFVLGDVETNQGIINLAVACVWMGGVSSDRLEELYIRKCYLYKGSIPDEVLDEINELGPSKDWRVEEQG